MGKYTAIIIEPRQHLALPFVLKNFNENLEKEWSFIIFHGTNNKKYVENIINTELIQDKNRFNLVNLNIENLYRNDYDKLLKQKSMIYDCIKTEIFLIFQVDTLILMENKHIINDFLEYDYVGAPWQDGVVGNGGLSLRRKSKMLEITNTIKIENGHLNEDEYFSRQKEIKLYTPSFEKAKKFSVETVFYDSPFGVHNCYNHLSQIEWNLLKNKYPELSKLQELNTLKKNPLEARFTIVYKTYKNDLKWLQYSLESLKKYIDPVNIFEIIIYSHDVVCGEVLKLLDEQQIKHFIPFRVLPVAYNYHGYIKQMVVKANCYKDVQTKYVILLDSDVLLQKYLDVEWLIQEGGKIEWKYLKTEDGPLDPIFSVWKKACDDSCKINKKINYMTNELPVVFTRKSLEEAANKFIEIHGRDYDSYCYVRCDELQIDVSKSFENQFFKLCKIFLFCDYLGFFCHQYSNDYIFTSIPYSDSCRENNIMHRYFFIQEKVSLKKMIIKELLVR